ncbi:hypothetical protein HW090_17740 [Pseudomonas sp. ABC1]|uniref:hypothetical protein n=1 Tax=Pseudomonas sp. ABC1 TaxID=2748080 RepID=UPI0015C33484|nr:hypothetical protein [Pseudomonas sp. ABC1]QLF91680.1 hypothetical protein HW090_17740 [Pseudomonas sp. ABC1]
MASVRNTGEEDGMVDIGNALGKELQAMLPRVFFRRISRLFPGRGFIAGLKYMTGVVQWF